MDTNNINGLIANQNNDQWQQMIGNWASNNYDPTINIPIPTPKYMPTYIDYETLRKTRVADKHKEAEYQEIMANVSKYISNMQRSPIQALLDGLFSLEEKFEYLLSIGYRKIEGSSYLTKGEPDPEFKRTFTVEEAFLEEMKIKLKNVLLSKQALKFKI